MDISIPRTSGAGVRSMTTMDNTTLPWTGLITNETPAPAQAESRWHRQGAKPKSSAPSTSCLRPADPLCFIREDGVEASVSSTPLRRGEPRSAVHRGTGARRSPPPPPLDLPLDNRFDILSLQDFPPVGALSGSGPAHPASRGSRQSRMWDPPVQPDPSPPSRPGETATRRHKPEPQAPSCLRRTSRQTVERRTPSVLVVGTSMVRHVAAHGGRTSCHPGASVKEVASSALQLSAQHSSASTLVLEAGINNLKNQQSQVLSLVDRLLDTGKRLIIAGPLPPPWYGDVTTSRLRQLHLWLKGYCLTKSILFFDNFAVFLNRPSLFKGTASTQTRRDHGFYLSTLT